MARIRTIKPDFWTDEKIVELSMEARLFFIGSWNFADDNGNLQRSARKLKMQIFPADTIDCEPLIESLKAHGLLIEYTVNGEQFLHIKGFKAHQVINRPSKSGLPNIQNADIPSTLTESSLTEGKGKEGKGKEGKGIEQTSSSDTSNTLGACPSGNPDDDQNLEEPKIRTRGVAVAILLRSLGVKPMTSMHPNCVEWADNPKITDALLTAAVEQARQYKPTDDIHPNYLKPIVDELLQPKRDDNGWKRSNEGIERKGRELGLFATRNEDYKAFSDRISLEIAKRKREGATA